METEKDHVAFVLCILCIVILRYKPVSSCNCVRPNKICHDILLQQYFPAKYWPCAFVYNAAARNSLAFDWLFDGKFDKLSLKIGWVSIHQFFLHSKKNWSFSAVVNTIKLNDSFHCTVNLYKKKLIVYTALPLVNCNCHPLEDGNYVSDLNGSVPWPFQWEPDKQNWKRICLMLQHLKLHSL